MVELDNIDDHNEHPIITYFVELFVPHVMILESSYPYLLVVTKRVSCWVCNFVCEPYDGEDERNPRINLPRKLATSGTGTGVRLSTLLSQIHNVAHIKPFLIIVYLILFQNKRDKFMVLKIYLWTGVWRNIIDEQSFKTLFGEQSLYNKLSIKFFDGRSIK